MPTPLFFVWLGLLITLGLLLIVLLEIFRSNQKRDHEVMFGTDAFEQKAEHFSLTEKERHTMEKLVRRSVFSNKDALFNSAILFEDAVNRFYEYRKLDSIRDITLSSVTDLRKKLGFTIVSEETPFVSTRQLEVGISIRFTFPNEREIEGRIIRIDEKSFSVEFENAQTEIALLKDSKFYSLRWTRPGDAVYTVHPMVLGVRGKHVFLAHEIQIEKFQLRRWVREIVDFEVLAETMNQKIKGRLFDLSAGGILIGLEETAPAGSVISISFELPTYGCENVKILILRMLERKNEAYPNLFLHTASFAGEFGWTQEKVLQYIFEVRRAKKRVQMGVSS